MDYQVLTVPINEELEATLRQLHSDGWECVPGTFPVAIYNLQREPIEQQIEMGIDDSLVTIIKGNGH